MVAAIELCSGVGACRKTIDGTMCPSYMVTREEEHSTRGRANLLRAVLSGMLPPEELTGQRLFEALDLCLECKGCKAECPANVDMAKLKYEFLARYHETHGYPLRARLFGHIHTLNRLGTRLAPLSTWLTQSVPARWALEKVAGIDRRRPLPPFARQTFDAWWQRRGTRDGAPARPQVVLFADTFLRYNYPAIGRAAVHVLEGLGYEVVVPEVVCCGRPMISKGLLSVAVARARENLARLLPYARAGVPIVGCEPSCVLTFRDEIPDLLQSDDARLVANRAWLVDEFLYQHVQDRGWPASPAGRKVLLHGHCHQKAVVGTRAVTGVLRAAGFEVQEVDSGCCGMAGSFGFEREHYDISLAIGERRLLPAVRSVPVGTTVVAMGVSCRQQIAHGAGRRALHLVEALEPQFGDSHAGKSAHRDTRGA
jgi:Fe-S oxidoreductase